MNKLLLTIFVSALLAASSTALAGDSHGDRGQKDPRNDRGMQAMPVVDHFMRALRQLELSDDQKESIHAVMQDMKADIGPAMKETKAGHARLKELIKADVYDEDAVAELATKEGELAAERMLTVSRAMSKVFSYLTEEQRSELDAMAAERMERRDDRRKQRGGEG